MTIPRIIHYVWVGPKAFPEAGRRYVEGWKQLMPDYTFMMWTEETIDFSPLFVRQAYGVGAYNRVANYARLAALRRHGGIYLDHDIEALKTFDALLEDDCFIGFQTMKADVRDVVNNAVIGATPEHPFIEEALDTLDGLDGGKDLGSRTGPGLLSETLRKHGPLTPSDEPQRHAGVTLYPPRFFYPYEWQETFTPACITPDTVAIHHWDHTWRHQPGLKVRIRKALLKRFTKVSPTLSANIAKVRNARSRRSQAKAQA